jgi:positive regulator of sigma E activity
MIDQDALLAALLTFCVCLLAILFLPVVADQLPDLARTAIVYGAVLIGAAALFQFIRRKRR